MSRAALEDFAARQQALVRALDADDVGAVESATAELVGAVARVRAAGGWSGCTLAARIAELSASAQAAQARVNFLTDRTARRIERLDALRGRRTAPTYRRSR